MEFFVSNSMTAVRYKRIWIKVVVIVFLIAIGIAGIYFAYITEGTQPAVQEERIEEEKLPDPEPV